MVIAELALLLTSVLGSPVAQETASNFYGLLSEDEQGVVDSITYQAASDMLFEPAADVDVITSPLTYLGNLFPDYSWELIHENDTSFVSGLIPVEVKGVMFPESCITTALEEGNYPSSYGGCGPIAMMGIFDYFARALDYSFICTSTNNATNTQTDLAAEVLASVNTIELGNGTTFTDLISYQEGFEAVVANHGLSSVFTMTKDWTVLGGIQNLLWNRVVANINLGMPLTLATYFGNGGYNFGGHYSNIYGYSEWLGTNQFGNTLTRRFLKGRLNFGNSENSIKYCDASVLGNPMLTLFAHHYITQSSYDIYPSAFSGHSSPIYPSASTSGMILNNGHLLYTERKRAGFTNNYLTFSANKIGEGESYLSLATTHTINSASFDFRQWSSAEYIQNETIAIQFYRSGTWYDRVVFSADALEGGSALKFVLFPNTTMKIRIKITCFSPTATTDGGRIRLNKVLFDFIGPEYPVSPLDFGEMA